MTYIDPSDMIKNPQLDDNRLHLSNNPNDDNYLYAASATDMTGLAPTVAHNEYEAQSYEDVFPYLPPIPPNSAVTVPDTPIAEGIHAEYRTHVTKQSNKEN